MYIVVCMCIYIIFQIIINRAKHEDENTFFCLCLSHEKKLISLSIRYNILVFWLILSNKECKLDEFPLVGGLICILKFTLFFFGKYNLNVIFHFCITWS